VPWWKYWLGRVLLWIAPRTRFRTGLDVNNMTRDPDFLALRRADKLIQKFVTVRWFFAAQYGLILAHHDANRVTCPILALQGLDDRTVNPEALRRWWPHVPAENKELVEFPGRVHEMLFDSDWKALTDRIADWLEKLD
jgi:alpha-beta hydrolase superfamily lysophospholipase